MPCFLMHICPKINRVSGIHCAFARCTRLHIIFYKNVVLIYFTLPWMGTTDNFDIVLHFHSSSSVQPELVKLRPLQSLMSFSHLFFCLPLLLVYAAEMYLAELCLPCPRNVRFDHLRFRFLTIVRSREPVLGVRLMF